MQKWMDIPDAEYGLTILNNNRYGFNATPRGLYITLTRTPVYSSTPFHSAHELIRWRDRPKYLDLGTHSFELGLFPHLGNWQDRHVWQEGYNFNLPLITPESLNLVDLGWNEDLRSDPFSAEMLETVQQPFIETDCAKRDSRDG